MLVHNTCGEPEVYYRAMSEKHFKRLERDGLMPGTGETFISPTEAYASNYKGALVRFELEPGTTSLLEGIGIKNNSPITNRKYPNMRSAEGVNKWNTRYALFKGEGLGGKKGLGKEQINIGLGKGTALDIFNSKISSYTRIR